MNEIVASQFSDLENFDTQHRGWLFRGLRNPNWSLDTTLERASRRHGICPKAYEKAIVREFQRHAPAYLSRVPSCDDYVEWLALMQHYGAPTRFLDFTKSFWIALFFAY